MTLDEAIKHEEEVAEEKERDRDVRKIHLDNRNTHNNIVHYEKACKYAEEHRQLAEWLKELKTHREIHDVLLQTLVDFDLDICCDDLTDNEEEQKICEENCTNKTKGCWVRWAKMKAMEKCKNANLLEQQPCDDCVSRAYIESIVEELENICVNGDEHILDLLADIKNAPPVTPHWVDDKCSACGKGIEDLIDSREWYRNEKPNFCPFCGLRLVDSQESEE